MTGSSSHTPKSGAVGSGLPVEQSLWSIFWLAEGVITRRQAFRTRDEALEAAGLLE
jgi:hypothetical protein